MTLDQKVIKLRLLRVVADDGVMADWRSALGGKATVSLLSDLRSFIPLLSGLLIRDTTDVCDNEVGDRLTDETLYVWLI